RLPLPALHQFEQPWLLGYIPIRVSRTVVRQHRHLPLLRPFAKPSAGGGSQMFNLGRAKHLQKKIFVRLSLLPAPVRLGLSLRPCAYRNKDYTVCSRLLERRLHSLAGELRAIDVNKVISNFKVLGLSRVKPRTSIFGIPVTRPVCQFERAAFQHPATRIAEKTHVLLRQHIDAGMPADQFEGFGYVAHAIGSTGLNWQPSTKKLKKLG